jgi:hypothetical protein
VLAATTLARRHESIKPLFVACSEAGILASDLSRFPRVIEMVARRLAPSKASRTFAMLHILLESRHDLGFELLDASGLKQLSRLLPEHESVQTAYIPPRIWTYQVLRLRECLDDYLAHREQIEACFRFCLQAHRHNAGSWVQAFTHLKPQHTPFQALLTAGHVDKDGRRYYGSFRLTAERFGIDTLLDRWVHFTDKAGRQ